MKKFAVEHTQLFDMKDNKGIIVAYDEVDGKRSNFREANAEELIMILEGYTATTKKGANDNTF